MLLDHCQGIDSVRRTSRLSSICSVLSLIADAWCRLVREFSAQLLLMIVKFSEQAHLHVCQTVVVCNYVSVLKRYMGRLIKLLRVSYLMWTNKLGMVHSLHK